MSIQMKPVAKPEKPVSHAQQEPKTPPEIAKDNEVDPTTSKKENLAIPTHTESDSIYPDMDLLWTKIFEDGEAQKGSFNIIRKGASLEKITDGEFMVSSSSTVKVYLENNCMIIEDLMEKHTGKRRRMRCVTRDGNEDTKKEDSPREVASKLESMLGFPVDVE